MQPPTALPKTTKNVHVKSKPEQKSFKAKKGKQPLQQTAMTHANPKHVRGQPMLTANRLREAGKYCVELYNCYIQNYKTGQDIIVQFKNCHFLVGDDIFVVTFSNLYDIFNLDALDTSLMCYFAL
jgi:hypothetical protein